MSQASHFIRWFVDIGINDVGVVGGKNAALGELYRQLAPAGVRVPNGFAVTVEAFRHFMRSASLGDTVAQHLAAIRREDLAGLAQHGQAIRLAILAAPLPSDLLDALVQAYRELGSGEEIDVAVRSSATAEDLPQASFAGQQETYLNVRGPAALAEACRRAFASLYTDRAISYRADQGLATVPLALSVGVQRMVRSDLASSGVMFTLDPETGFPDVVLINASYGLGEPIVQGAVTPDEYCVFKPTLATGHRPILRRVIGSKEFKLVYDGGGSRAVRPIPVALSERGRPALQDEDILALARWGCAIEAHFSQARGVSTPMDIEWAKDGVTGDLYVVQARPETVHARANRHVVERYRLMERGPVLVSGRSVGHRIAQGVVRVIPDATGLHQFRPGEVLVTDRTDPDWEPIMKTAAAIVTDRGGRTCHAAIVSRELGLPAIVGTEHGTERLLTGQLVTVACDAGEIGHVYEGGRRFEVERTDLSQLRRPRTRIMMNVGNPDEAFALASLPNDGVGLARLEFIIATSIGVHPMALVHYDGLPATVKDDIDKVTGGRADKRQYFVDTLADGVATIAAAFYPRDVIVRFSDFKTNEYARLVGGSQFEPPEENPMLGFRGASRYSHERYREGFGLECRAIRQVREVMGLRNVKVMVPFCRTVAEARRVTAELASHGLERGRDGLEVYMMVEIPSNVLLLAEFATQFDGFSIGSNDLTQLTLGIDRDSELVAGQFDERDDAVRALVARAIAEARRLGRKIGLCGQAPSDYPEFAKFLVECGIDSISLSPDAVLATTRLVLDVEAAAAQGRHPHIEEVPIMTPDGVVQNLRPDMDIFAEARRALDEAPLVPATVHVHVDDGVAWLTGVARVMAERAEAERIVRGLRGVRAVVNKVIVTQSLDADEMSGTW